MEVKMRTKIADRNLPSYTKGEEMFNMISHIVGICMGIAVLTMCVSKSCVNNNPIGVVSSVIYGTTMIILYAMSSIYHGLPCCTTKKVFRILDHCTIYFLIAGSYTPIALCALRVHSPTVGWTIFILEWIMTAIAVTLTSIDLKKYEVFSMVCYIAMGGGIIVVSKLAITALDTTGFTYLILGGISYIVGAILYGIGKKKKYRHSIFHLFVLMGSLLHFMCIYYHAL